MGKFLVQGAVVVACVLVARSISDTFVSGFTAGVIAFGFYLFITRGG